MHIAVEIDEGEESVGGFFPWLETAHLLGWLSQNCVWRTKNCLTEGEAGSLFFHNEGIGETLECGRQLST